jgi:hypothetical protein
MTGPWARTGVAVAVLAVLALAALAVIVHAVSEAPGAGLDLWDGYVAYFHAVGAQVNGWPR